MVTPDPFVKSHRKKMKQMVDAPAHISLPKQKRNKTRKGRYKNESEENANLFANIVELSEGGTGS